MATLALGIGSSLSTNYYKRNFYSSNRNAANISSRKNYSPTELSHADSAALRRAVKELGSFSYDTNERTDIQNSALAYVSTYNNLISSTSGTTDPNVARNSSQLKSLTERHANELDKAGITVNPNGTLTARDSYKTSGTIDRLKDLFSKDSEYMQKAASYAKRIDNRSETLSMEEKRRKNMKNAQMEENGNITSPDTVPPDSTGTASTLSILVSDSFDSNTLINPGIGTNINISL